MEAPKERFVEQITLSEEEILKELHLTPNSNIKQPLENLRVILNNHENTLVNSLIFFMSIAI